MPDDAGNALKYVVDDIFPRNLVHLVAGSIGLGKSTLLMQLIRAMHHGLEFLGKPAHDGRVVYITADRGKQETDDLLARLGMPGLTFKTVSIKDIRGEFPRLETLLRQNCAPGDVVFVEPINFFLIDPQGRPGDINNFIHVSHFLIKIGRIAEELSLTIIASMHSQKPKPGSEHLSPRERVIGSVAWTAFTATTVLVESTNRTDITELGRTVSVMPRNIRPFVLEFELDDKQGGVFMPVASTTPVKSQLDICLANHPQEAFTSQDVDSWRELANVSVRTAWRWLDQKVKDGQVLKIERGLYHKRSPV